jgi:hypothetical protein
LLAALLAAGCGGDDGGTRDDFIEEADSICEEASAELSEAQSEAFGDQKPTEAESLAFAQQSVIPSVQAQIDAIRDLEPPPGEAAQVNAILAAAQADLDRAKQNPSVLAREGAFSNSNRLASQYGLTACASG